MEEKIKLPFEEKIKKLYSDIEKLKLKKIKRNYNEIDKDYNNNSERWNRSFDEIDFETWLGNYNVDGEILRILTMNGKLFEGTWNEYAEKFVQQILDTLEKYSEENVVELGCGLGYILFQLNQKNFKKT